MIVERVHLNGGWRVTDIIDGYRVSRLYLDFTRKEAVEAFRDEVRHTVLLSYKG